MLAPVIIAALLIVFVLGRYHAYSLERALEARYRRTESGIISGAAAIERAGTNGAAVLLLHGAGDTPQTMLGLATGLSQRGYAVNAPLLPGHGRSLAEL